VTTHSTGSGRVTYVGTLPDPALGRAVAAWVLRTSGRATGWPGLPDHVTHTSATSADGRRLHFLNNWSWRSTEVPAMTNVCDVLSDAEFVTSGYIHMDSWEAMVLLEM
jgi:beta-galactosidase